MKSLPTPDLRIQEPLIELASIFAAGILRLHKRRLLAEISGDNKLSNSPRERLDVPPKTVLSVHPGELSRDISKPGARK